MSGCRDGTQSFETRFCNLVDAQKNTQRQLDVLATNFTTLIQTLNQNARYMNNVGLQHQVGRHEVSGGQNLVVLPQHQDAAAFTQEQSLGKDCLDDLSSGDRNIRDTDQNAQEETIGRGDEILAPKIHSPQLNSGDPTFS
ncbi:hypothetical protein MKW94_013930, partial [Papaver nudicaule]|nr:hypothetical protein [Papaver nudicaule]